MRQLSFVVLLLAGVLSSSGCSQACPAALLTGVLVEQDGELVVVPEAGGEPYRLDWSRQWQYRVRVDGDTLLVTDFFGRVAAREGDFVEIGGGETRESGGWVVCGSVSA